MAQWLGMYSGLTHATKVQDIEVSLRKAVTAFAAASELERAEKAKGVRKLSEQLLAARLKALHARLSALTEPGSNVPVTGLRQQERELHKHGVDGILKEFRFDPPATV